MKLQYIEQIQDYMDQLEIAYQIGEVSLSDYYLVEIEGVGKRVMILYDMCEYLKHICRHINMFVERYGHHMLNIILFGLDDNWSVRTETNSMEWKPITLKIGKMTDLGWSSVYSELKLDMMLDERAIKCICEALGFNWGVTVF